MTGEIVIVEGRYRDAAMRKPAWQAEKAKERHEFRAWQFADDPDKIGAWGEAALCQFLGADPDREMFKDDPTEPDVWGVEVRTTTCRTGHLIIRQPKVTTEHVLAIVGPERRFVHLVGWLTPEKINDDRRHPFRPYGKGPDARWIRSDDLNQDMGELCRRVYCRRDGIVI